MTVLQITGLRAGTTRFPSYDGAGLGLEDFWYPVMWSRDLGKKPVALTRLRDVTAGVAA